MCQVEQNQGCSLNSVMGVLYKPVHIHWVFPHHLPAYDSKTACTYLYCPESVGIKCVLYHWAVGGLMFQCTHSDLDNNVKIRHKIWRLKSPSSIFFLKLNTVQKEMPKQRIISDSLLLKNRVHAYLERFHKYGHWRDLCLQCRCSRISTSS